MTKKKVKKIFKIKLIESNDIIDMIKSYSA